MKCRTLLMQAMFIIIATETVYSQTSMDTTWSSGVSSSDTIAPSKENGFDNRRFLLDEVVVVAQPKETQQLRLQPLSSTSFLPSDIRQKGFSSMQSLADFTPSFAMPTYGSRLTASTYMRGVGTRTGGAPVAMYVDGMPIMSKSAYNTYLYGIDRVDILRGAQGTLYGQNSESGLIRVNTKSPVNYQGIDLMLSGATGGEYVMEGTYYTLLSEKAAIAVGGFLHRRNGWQRNTNLNQRADSLNEAGGRLRLVLKPWKRITFDIISDYQHAEQTAFPYGIVASNGAYAANPATTFPNRYRRDMMRNGLNISWKGQRVDFFSTTSHQYLKDKMVMDQDYLPTDYLTLIQQQLHNALTQEFVLRSSDNVNSSRRYRWITGLYGSYQWMKTTAPVSFGPGITTPISTGIYNAMYNAMVQQMKQAFIARGMSDEAATAAAKQMIEKQGGVSVNTTMDTPGRFHTPEYNLAIYHESTYRLLPRLNIVAGLRYDYSHVSLRYDTQSTMAVTANVMGTEATNTLHSSIRNSLNNHFSQLLPKIGLTLNTSSSGNNVYLLVSKGYRAGGYNMQMFSDVLRKELNDNSANAMRSSYEVPHTDEDYRNIAQTISYKPEISWNYEAGLHQDIVLSHLNRDHLRIDASMYFMQVRNQQLSVMAGNYGYGRSMVNAGRSNSCGMELSLQGLLLKTRLSWGLNYSYTHATFRNYTDEIATADGTEPISYKGHHVPFVPQHMLSANANYRINMDKILPTTSLTVGMNTTMQGKTYWNESNTRWQSVYAQLGANATLDIRRFGQITLWGRNLTKTRYNTFLVESAASGEQLAFAQRGTPRQMGIDIKINL